MILFRHYNTTGSKEGKKQENQSVGRNVQSSIEEDDLYEQGFFKKGAIGHGFEWFTSVQKERMIARTRTELSEFLDLIKLWQSVGVVLRELVSLIKKGALHK